MQVCIESSLQEEKKEKKKRQHEGLELMSVLQLAFQSGALPTELSLPCYEVKRILWLAFRDAEMLLSGGPR